MLQFTRIEKEFGKKENKNDVMISIQFDSDSFENQNEKKYTTQNYKLFWGLLYNGQRRMVTIFIVEWLLDLFVQLSNITLVTLFQ